LKYYSTSNKTHQVSLEKAVIKGLAPDNGLYMPEKLTPMPASFFDTLHQKSFQEIAFEVANHLLGEDVAPSELRRMVNHTISFDAPLIKLEENIFSLELFHGPTLAFKDFGARFMSQLLGHFARKSNREVTILVATSGDTGSAVANGFLGVEGTKVVVLYPSGKVSEVQEKQFTTLGKNIVSLEVDGTFDDCQRLVKQAFMDDELQSKLFLTSANSINIARLIPQSFYYFYAWSRLENRSNVVFSVPSGNFGNLTAGLIAKKLGLSIHHFVASTNANDIVPHYLLTKEFLPKPSVSTISNAMDVGNPSNFARILDLFQGDWNQISSVVTGYSFSDAETKSIMKSVFQKQGYIVDPHGAVGLLGLKKYLASNKEATGIFLETAHPTKFISVVEDAIDARLELPEKLKLFLGGTKQSVRIPDNFSRFKSLLLG
jgi:threonine synthase